jgi:hypothetical protein
MVRERHIVHGGEYMRWSAHVEAGVGVMHFPASAKKNISADLGGDVRKTQASVLTIEKEGS